MNTVTSSKKAVKAFTLIELITAIAIFSFVLVALSYVLDASLDQLRSRTRSKEVTGNYRVLFDIFRTDLQGAQVGFPLAHSFGDAIPAELKELIDGRSFLPFEINRENGKGLPKSIVNGESGFSSLLFASKTSASYAHPIRDQLRLNGVSDFNQSADALSEISLVGYYVAYTKDSDSTSRRSMKLYRHFRPGGITFGNGHSNGILAHAGDVLDPTSSRTILDGTSFENKSLPYLLGYRYTDPVQMIKDGPVQPWPKFADELPAPPPAYDPPNYNETSWADPGHAIHNFVFGDEVVAVNVLEFQCEPYIKIETSPGVVELFDTQRLNERLGLSQNDWPILVKPDFVDISVAVVGEDAAIQLETKSDWVSAPDDVAAADMSAIDRIKKQQTKRFAIRLPLN